MIVHLNQLVPYPEQGHWYLTIPVMTPLGLAQARLIGFEGKTDLPEIAEFLHKYIMNLFERWDETTGKWAIEDLLEPDDDIKTDIPDAFLTAWEEGDEFNA